MRQFYLENEYGEQFQLNDVQTGFLHNPKGLGYKLSNTYTKIGTAWKRNKSEDTQASISGEVVVGTSSPYEAVQSFLAFVRKSTELVLHRITPAGEHLKDVDLVNFDVSEIGDGDFLTIPVTFTAKSLWYTKTNSVYSVTQQAGGKKYAYDYTYKYLDYGNGSLTIENNGSVDAPMMVVFNGAVSNPVMTLEVDGEELYRVEITGQAAAGDRIEWSSRDGNLFCETVTAAGVRTNLVPDFDINNANFFKAPVGTSVIKFSAASAITSPILVTMYKQFRAV